MHRMIADLVPDAVNSRFVLISAHSPVDSRRMVLPGTDRRSRIRSGVIAAAVLVCVLTAVSDLAAASHPTRPRVPPPAAGAAGLLGGEAELRAWNLASAALAAGAA